MIISLLTNDHYHGLLSIHGHYLYTLIVFYQNLQQPTQKEIDIRNSLYHIFISMFIQNKIYLMIYYY